MSVWADRSRALRRYLMSHVGVTVVELDSRTRSVTLPRTPWKITLSSARSHGRTIDAMYALRERPDGSIFMFSYGAERVEDFIVTMTLRTAAPLLEAHYKTEVLPRIQEGE